MVSLLVTLDASQLTALAPGVTEHQFTVRVAGALPAGAVPIKLCLDHDTFVAFDSGAMSAPTVQIAFGPSSFEGGILAATDVSRGVNPDISASSGALVGVTANQLYPDTEAVVLDVGADVDLRLLTEGHIDIMAYFAVPVAL